MPGTRKLGKTTAQRMAMLRQQVTDLLDKGRMETTVTRAKEIAPMAEKMITLAVREYKNSETVEKDVMNEKGQVSKVEKVQDLPSKLHARRQIMAYLYDVPELKKAKERKSAYKERTKDRAHPVVEKLFRDLAPKYDARIQEGMKGGYTRIYKLGARRGDAAPMVVLELV